jgi:hypothetical protein
MRKRVHALFLNIVSLDFNALSPKMFKHFNPFLCLEGWHNRHFLNGNHAAQIFVMETGKRADGQTLSQV